MRDAFVLEIERKRLELATVETRAAVLRAELADLEEEHRRGARAARLAGHRRVEQSYVRADFDSHGRRRPGDTRSA